MLELFSNNIQVVSYQSLYVLTGICRLSVSFIHVVIFGSSFDTIFIMYSFVTSIHNTAFHIRVHNILLSIL